MDEESFKEGQVGCFSCNSSIERDESDIDVTYVTYSLASSEGKEIAKCKRWTNDHRVTMRDAG